ncbi:MAG: hypothetical protein H0U95_07755 [Bacteroidetes bacterium]|nr:hypothetical protein [Bacteroidota bacterium]
MKQTYFSSFGSFFTGRGRSIIFTSLFYSLWLVISIVSSADLNLHSFSGRMIGIATMNNVDVEARVALFYKCIAVFFGAFLVFTFLGYIISRKKETLLSCTENRLINYASVTGIFIFIFKVFNVEVYETLEFIYFFHKLMLVSITIRILIYKENKLSVYQLSTILLWAAASYFLIADLNNFLGNLNNPDLYITTFIIALLLFVVVNLFLRNSKRPNPQAHFRIIIFAFLPLLALPFMSVLKDELFLVLKSNGIVLADQKFIYLGLLLILSLLIIYRYKKGKKNEIISEKDLLAKNYFPLFIFSLFAYLSYSYYAEYYDEIFESGNVYLPIMEYKLFGTLSPVEKLNTHLLSDYFFSYIYVFFNGLKINEITLYDFFLLPISCTLFYFLFRFLTRNEFVAIFLVLFFPYAEVLMPEGFCFSILGIFALFKVIGAKQSVKNYLIYFSVLLFLICWRIDLGYNCLLTMLFLLLYYHFRDQQQKINWRVLFKSIVYSFGFIVTILTTLSVVRQKNLFSNLGSFLNYCASAQSYGYHSIGDNTTTVFKAQYFIFPAIVAILMIIMVIKYKELNKSKSQRQAYLSLLFICIFYFVNFNRGLIRHSLLEGSDGFVASFIYIILPASVFVLFRKENNLVKSAMFFVIAFVTINTYRLPEPKGMKSFFERLEEKTKNTQNIMLSTISSRVSNAPDTITQRYKPFSDFIKKNTKPDETFIDFSNRPMLYFFTKKETPSWFYQSPLCVQNDFLQEKFINGLKDYKTPYLLFSGLSEVGYDNIDDVPNSVRHYKMAEYFYNNYKPFIIVNNFCLWRSNATKDINKKDTIFTYFKITDSIANEKTIKTGLKIKPDKVYTVMITSQNKMNYELSLMNNGNTTFPQIKSINENSVYSILDVKENFYDLTLKNDWQQITEFLVIESDHIPDYFSHRTLFYNFEKLPYVWGANDKLLSDQKILFEKNEIVLLEANKAYSLSIPEKMDRSSGNTIIITCKNTGKGQKAKLLFGNTSNKNPTTIQFDIIPSDKQEKYAIRISSIYKWYSENVNRLSIITDSNKDLTISNITITKGN